MAKIIIKLDIIPMNIIENRPVISMSWDSETRIMIK